MGENASRRMCGGFRVKEHLLAAYPGYAAAHLSTLDECTGRSWIMAWDREALKLGLGCLRLDRFRYANTPTLPFSRQL